MDKEDKRELLLAITQLGDKLSAELRTVSDRLCRLEGRFEEQSRTVTALIPQRIAAVPERKQ
jgi:hypothetical protein